jgi:hypothetical protein
MYMYLYKYVEDTNTGFNSTGDNLHIWSYLVQNERGERNTCSFRSLWVTLQASERAAVLVSSTYLYRYMYIAVIVVFSKSRDKWLKNKLTWQNDRAYVKIVLIKKLHLIYICTCFGTSVS